VIAALICPISDERIEEAKGPNCGVVQLNVIQQIGG
jgi:hypothetical protein